MLNVYMPRPINVIFEVTPDESTWNGEYRRNGNNIVPDRKKFLIGNQILNPTKASVHFFKNEDTNYGVYILLFNGYEKFYVGVAGRHSFINANGNLKKIQNPEGFMTRLRKHRLKCTGSFGNLNHTDHNGQGWRNLAMRRWCDHNARGEIDLMDDCELSLVTFANPADHQENDRGKLEWLEHYIANGHLNRFVGDQYADYSCFARTRQPAVPFPGLLAGLEHRPFPF